MCSVNWLLLCFFGIIYELALNSHLSANDARKKDSAMAAEVILSAVLALFSDKPYLQLGGNETLGMGWCAISILGGE